MNKFLIKNSQRNAQGLFSTLAYEPNQVLFKFEGKNISTGDMLKHPNSEKLLQIGDNMYVDLGSHYSAFTNHSCNPNCYVKIAINTAFLISARDIAIGDELFFDYSLTSTDTLDTWKMDCKCHKFYCRKVISGFSTIPEEKKKSLIKAGMVPAYQ